MSLDRTVNELDELMFSLERAFERSGACFVVAYAAGKYAPDEIASLLAQDLAQKNIPVQYARLVDDPGPETAFRDARFAQKPVVLIVWCFEHLENDAEIIKQLGWLRGRREWLSQVWQPGSICIPIVFLTSQTIYRQYFGAWAGDFLEFTRQFQIV